MHFDVVIVGAGPAGLMTALGLARQGVRCLLVDRREEESTLPRATVVSLRSMELLRSWGLEAQVRAGAVDVAWQQWHCASLAAVAKGEGQRLSIPTDEQSAVVSPTSPACVPQDWLEPVLRRALAARPSARMESGTSFAGVSQDSDGVEVALRDPSGAERTVGASYLVGADGAHSRVRRAVGIAMHGPDNLYAAATALFRAPLDAVIGKHRYFIYSITDPAVGGIFLPAGRGDRWLYATVWDPREHPGLAYDEAELHERIVRAAGVPGLHPRIERTGSFTFAAQLAERYREGRVLLAGDAAHRATPRGGTGMNTALQDGYDLSYRLARVLRGESGPEFLDLYEAERRPAAAHNVALSAEPLGTLRAVEDELPVELGGRIPHVWVRPGVSTLDLLGDGITRLKRDELPAHAALALGLRDGGELRVRPDGVAV